MPIKIVSLPAVVALICILSGCEAAKLVKAVVLLPISVTDQILGTHLKKDINESLSTKPTVKENTTEKITSNAVRKQTKENKRKKKKTKEKYITKTKDRKLTIPPKFNIKTGTVYWGDNINTSIYILSASKKYTKRYSNDWRYALSYCSNLKNLYYIDCIQNKIGNLYSKDIFEIADILFELKINEEKEWYTNKKVSLKSLPTLKKGEFETTDAFNKRNKKQKEEIGVHNKISIKKFTIHKNSKLKEIEINRNNPTYKKEVYLKIIQKLLYIKYEFPALKSVHYNADRQFFTARLYSKNKKINKTIRIPVKRKYAKVFKELLLRVRSTPVIEFSISNNKLIFNSVKQLNEPKYSVEKKEFYECYKVVHFINFIKRHPNSPFVIKAKKEINTINKKNKEKKERIKSAGIRKEQDRKRKDKSYANKKYIGDKVCKDGTTAIILPITITAYVERVNGNKVQLRISDTEGTFPHYNGVTLTKHSLIWDDYYTWYKCNY